MTVRALLPTVALVGTMLAVAAAAAACEAATGDDSATGDDAPGTSTAGDGLSGEVVVFAAASLGQAFEVIANELEADHSDLAVTLSLAGSQQLAAQILAGAPADVFASADGIQMSRIVVDGEAAHEPVAVAANRLTIAVERGNPLGIDGLADLADPDVLVVAAAPEVPAGAYTRELLARADVELAPVSLEADVRAVLTKVEIGEADAGIVYASDVTAAGEAVTEVELPSHLDVHAEYPAVVLANAPNPAAAKAFLDLVRSDRGHAVLAEFGFLTP